MESVCFEVTVEVFGTWRLGGEYSVVRCSGHITRSGFSCSVLVL